MKLWDAKPPTYNRAVPKKRVQKDYEKGLTRRPQLIQCHSCTAWMYDSQTFCGACGSLNM